MRQSVRDGFIPFNEPLEGRVRFMYLDVKSLVSTGIGNLLDADDPSHFGAHPHLLPPAYGLGWYDKNDPSETPVAQSEIDAEYTAVKFSGSASWSIKQKETLTRLRITDATIDQLVNDRLTDFEASLRSRTAFSALNNWPADAQLGLLSMAWAMGPAFSFPKFQAAAKSADWRTMAAESKMSEAGNPGVIPRNVRNALLFMIASWVAEPPPGDFSQLVYDPSLSLADNMRSGNFPMPINLLIGVQTALETLANRLGNPTYDPHGLDGVIGSGTRNAINAFETDHQLPKTSGINEVSDIPSATIDAFTAELDTLGVGWWR